MKGLRKAHGSCSAVFVGPIDFEEGPEPEVGEGRSWAMFWCFGAVALVAIAILIAALR